MGAVETGAGETGAALRSQYVVGTDGRDEQHRLLAAEYDPRTRRRIAETGVANGWHCLEIGTGCGSIATWLAGRVAPAGSVLATDVRPVPDETRPSLVFRRHDITTDPLESERFDLVVARLVLRHLPERDAVLERLVRALVPGGWLLVEEFDTDYEPLLLAADEESAALYRKFLAAKATATADGGVDPGWGRKVATAMRAAGLVDIDPRPFVRLRDADSPETQLLAHHTAHLREKLLAAGMTADELTALREVLRHPEFRACSSLLYSVLGRKAV